MSDRRCSRCGDAIADELAGDLCAFHYLASLHNLRVTPKGKRLLVRSGVPEAEAMAIAEREFGLHGAG